MSRRIDIELTSARDDRTFTWLAAGAGEGESPENIWQAAYHLHADRIGHGLTLTANPQLAARFRDRGICLELCPSSNREVVGFADPANVQRVCRTPGATSYSRWVTGSRTLCTAGRVDGASAGLCAAKFASGEAIRSRSPTSSPEAVAIGILWDPEPWGASESAALGGEPPMTATFSAIPSHRWPAIEHHPSIESVTTPTLRVSVLPVASRAVR